MRDDTRLAVVSMLIGVGVGLNLALVIWAVRAMT